MAHAQNRQVWDELYEHVLVVRCQAGDAEAFVELVHRRHAGLARYARRLTGAAVDVDDVMQEVWLAVYRKLPALRRPSALRCWLYRITRNAALAKLRSVRPWAPLVEETLPGADDDAEQLLAEEEASQVHAALERLHVGHREVLLLRFVEELRYEEIAEVLRCTLGTVRSRLHRAKEALKRELRG